MFKFRFTDGSDAILMPWEVPDAVPFTLQAILDWLFMVKDDGSKERVTDWLWDKIDNYGDLVSVEKC